MSNITKRIVFQRPDGGITLRCPCDPQRESESETDWLDRIAAKRPRGERLFNVDLADLPPTGRRFRDCWRLILGEIRVDRALAVQQVLTEVRQERNTRLLATDAERARLEDVGTAEQRAALAAKRQALRDLPAVVSGQLAGLTVAQLATYQPVWPE